MNNTQLKRDTKSIVKQKGNITVTKGTVSGASIEVFNTKTNEDIGSFTYYDRVNQRDADFVKLTAAINE